MKAKFVVMINPGEANEYEDSRHIKYKSAVARKTSIENCGDVADVYMVDDYGRLTSDF